MHSESTYCIDPETQLAFDQVTIDHLEARIDYLTAENARLQRAIEAAYADLKRIEDKTIALLDSMSGVL